MKKRVFLKFENKINRFKKFLFYFDRYENDHSAFYFNAFYFLLFYCLLQKNLNSILLWIKKIIYFKINYIILLINNNKNNIMCSLFYQ